MAGIVVPEKRYSLAKQTTTNRNLEREVSMRLRLPRRLFMALVVTMLAIDFFSAGGTNAQAQSTSIQTPHYCAAIRMYPGIDPSVQQGSKNWLEHHFYVAVNYHQSGSYSVYDATLNLWFDQNNGRWGDYGNSTRYGIHTTWAVPNQWHFWTDTWVLFDSGSC